MKVRVRRVAVSGYMLIEYRRKTRRKSTLTDGFSMHLELA
jgi:hypothetical protein